MNNNAVPELIAMLNSGKGTPKANAAMIEALGRICAIPVHGASVVQAGGIPAVIGAYNRDPGSIAVVQSTAAFMQQVAKSPEGAAELVNNNGIGAIVRMMYVVLAGGVAGGGGGGGATTVNAANCCHQPTAPPLVSTTVVASLTLNQHPSPLLVQDRFRRQHPCSEPVHDRAPTDRTRRPRGGETTRARQDFWPVSLPLPVSHSRSTPRPHLHLHPGSHPLPHRAATEPHR